MTRTILHLDMNSFFAAVEQAANPFLRGKPLVVGGGISKTSVVAACSYEAKLKGITNAMPAWEAKKICPEVIIIPGDMAKYISTSKAIMKYLTKYTELVEVFSIDEAWLDLTERGNEIEIAKEIKKWIREQFNLTCNIGIAWNKLMAKFAGELKKPDALIILRSEDIPGKVVDVPVSKLCGVGRKLEGYLAELGVRTFGDLNAFSREKLVERFGIACGEHLWYMGQGRDDSPVMPYWHEEEAKSVGHSYTLPRFTRDPAEVKGYLLRLSEQVGRRMRREKYTGNVVHLSLGFACPERSRGSNFEFWGKQKKIADHINDGYDIYKIGEAIFDEYIGGSDRPFRFVGITVSGLVHNLDQISIFERVENHKKVLEAVDEINDRYGEFTVERAAIMNTVLHRKTGMVTSGLYKRF